MEFIVSDTDKLLEAGVIKVVPHPTWVANPVVGPKPNFSLLCFRRTCFTGRASVFTASLCSITSLGTPGKPDASHTKTSEFSRRKHVEGDPSGSAIRKTSGGCFLDPKPRSPGRDPVGARGDYG